MRGNKAGRIPFTYYLAQLRQSFAKWSKDVSFRTNPSIDLILASTALPHNSRILCLGARNRIELDAWKARGYHRVTAIDLLPSLGIIPMDFHRLLFAADSFTLIYASHALEHSWDAGRVAREIVRVLKPGGWLFAAFPIQFTPTDHDRYDFGSVEGFLKLFDFARLTRLWHRETPTEVAVLARLEAK